MPTEEKLLLIDNVISPRMFDQVSCAASNLDDICESELEDIKKFPYLQIIMRDEIVQIRVRYAVMTHILSNLWKNFLVNLKRKTVSLHVFPLMMTT